MAPPAPVSGAALAAAERGSMQADPFAPDAWHAPLRAMDQFGIEKYDCRSCHAHLKLGNFRALKHGQDAHATGGLPVLSRMGQLAHATCHGHLARVCEYPSKKRCRGTHASQSFANMPRHLSAPRRETNNLFTI